MNQNYASKCYLCCHWLTDKVDIDPVTMDTKEVKINITHNIGEVIFVLKEDIKTYSNDQIL